MVREGKVYPAVIEGCASDGSGVARIGGMAVFVKGAIRGERVEVYVEHVGHNAAWGRVEKLLEASPARIAPDCPHYGVCGGCQFRHMSYEEELEAKRTRVADAFSRIGGVELTVGAVHGAEDTARYRNKVQFPVAQGAIGYYRGRSHQVVDIVDCLLQPKADTACRTAVKGWMEQYAVPAYDERTGKGLVRHLYLRTNQAGQALCCLVVNGRDIPRASELVDALRAACPGLVGVVVNVNTKKTNVILGREYRTLWGEARLEETLCGHTFRLSVPSFFQVNRAQTEVLYRLAVDFAALTGGETVVELYCGIGAISLALAERAGQVIGVEVVPQAIADAKENAARNGLAHKTRFECGDAAELAAQLEKEGVRPDVVVVDPPRKGLAPEVVDTIVRMGPDRVVYVSCDPATLARDIKRFTQMNYTAVRAEAVDLFPRTAHVETVVLLSRKVPDDVVEVDLEPEEMGHPRQKYIPHPAGSERRDRQIAINKMVRKISGILQDRDPSIYLYGSSVLNDFRLGWSDIDILVLLGKRMSAEQAQMLVGLRQGMLEEEPGNPYYSSFEGGMLTLDAFLSGKNDRVVYWGTSGEQITDRYMFDSFGMAELMENSALLYGKDIRGQLKAPAFGELYADVKRHYETIRKNVQKTGRNFYSFGWMLDIARCIYTLRTGKIIAKTCAAEWALENNLCPASDVLKNVLKIRMSPLENRDEQTFDYAETLAELIQRFADVLEKELERSEM